MITLVNGYVCNNCSEAAEARRGKDPHAKPGELPNAKDKSDKISGFADRPATMIDGALRGLASTQPVTATSNFYTSVQGGSATSPQTVDISV